MVYRRMIKEKPKIALGGAELEGGGAGPPAIGDGEEEPGVPAGERGELVTLMASFWPRAQ